VTYWRARRGVSERLVEVARDREEFIEGGHVERQDNVLDAERLGGATGDRAFIEVLVRDGYGERSQRPAQMAGRLEGDR
jgi:hypothetical protein